MVKILVRIGLFAGCFLLLLPVSRSAGGTAKNPIQGMFTERVLPDGQILTCWRDICPGQTTVDEAIRILQADPTFYPPDDLDLANLRESPLCWQSRASSYTVCLDARDNLLVDLHLYLDLEDNANSSAHLRLHLGD